MPTQSDGGALTEGVYLILISLLQPRHGYAVMQNIAQLTAGRLTLGAGTLYGALNTLLTRGWIEALTPDAGSRTKQYVITDDGLAALQGEITRLRQLTVIGEQAIGGNK